MILKPLIAISRIIFALISINCFCASLSFAASPKVNLFPRNVTEHLSHTGQSAAAMERSLKRIISGLETQRQLYSASGCEGSTDPGCSEISKQLGDHYQDLLSVMLGSLPEMRSSIAATNHGIQKNLRQELGKKKTPADLQKLLGKRAKPKVVNGRFSLSKRFAQYHKMISGSGSTSLAKLAAEIYLDTAEVLKTIDLMEAEMTRQKTIIDIQGMYGTLTPEMINTVDAVKSIIFGEDLAGEEILPESNEWSSEPQSDFQSPLERF